MMNFLRRAVSSSKQSSLIRIVAVATTTSGIVYAKTNPDAGTTISLAIPESVKESLSLPWQIPQGLIHRPDQSLFGNIAAFSSRVSPKSEAPANANDDEERVPVEASDSPKPSSGYLGRDTIANAAARIGPAVVNLSVPQGFYGISTGKSIGSGTIIDADGTILTCAHVVVDFQNIRQSSKGRVDVTLQDGRTFEGVVVNADLQSDIALVKIKSKTPLPTAKLGFSSKLCPGDWVIAVGCPLSLQNTITAGIVSCVDRKSSDLGLGGIRREYLQTDCAINAGNSGGPLVNLDGEVIGVNIMKVLAADGLGFSVPIDSVSKIIEHFKKSGVIRPWLGLKMIELNKMILAQLKERDPMFPDVERGILVPTVIPGSPADRAGFKPGDVVVRFDGKPVETIKEIIEIIDDRVGKRMQVVVERSNKERVTLEIIPEEANPDM
ncbi:putative protease Do-like 14 isoform X2 [Eutrema salsugineum]|uniref:putative protease Do-like 14 isoform X2 n=1 Tax=Eutrema salsugineum TaxID=72664 RepID=UPI000CED3FA3|nr:putative protease Do-like 14 isoform X2 [Eutrema salsugineum]